MKKLIYSFSCFLLISMFVLASTEAFAQPKNQKATDGREIIYYEPFDYSPGSLPPGWSVDSADVQWFVTNSNLAGGEAPELCLTSSMAYGSIHLVSAPINIEGHQELCLRLKQYLINAEMDFGEMIGIDVTFDNGQNWQVLWEKLIGLDNISPDEFPFYFTAPEGATEMQFEFRTEGNQAALNLWLVDDIVLETVPANDLLFTPNCFVDGDITPKAGEPSMFFLEVLNGGTATQTDYNIKMMTVDGVELTSIPGESVVFNEKKFFMVFWTPDETFINSPTEIYFDIDFQQDENPGNNQSKHMIINVLGDDVSRAQITPGSWPLRYLPYNFLSLNSLTQTLYFPDEIGFTDYPITGLQYTCQFDERVSVPIQIYLGETTQNDLSAGWIDPSDFTKVYDGNIDFMKGFNNLYIPLDTPYMYEGGNLVVYSNKSYSRMVIGTPFISAIDTGSMRSRSAERDDQPFDPMNPPQYSGPWDYYPNITLFYSTGPTSVNTVDQPAKVQMYPNPANSILHIQNDGVINEIKVLNTLGQVVFQQDAGSNQCEINVEDLKPGFYLVQVITPKGISTRKIQISR